MSSSLLINVTCIYCKFAGSICDYNGVFICENCKRIINILGSNSNVSIKDQKKKYKDKSDVFKHDTFQKYINDLFQVNNINDEVLKGKIVSMGNIIFKEMITNNKNISNNKPKILISKNFLVLYCIIIIYISANYKELQINKVDIIKYFLSLFLSDKEKNNFYDEFKKTFSYIQEYCIYNQLSELLLFDNVLDTYNIKKGSNVKIYETMLRSTLLNMKVSARTIEIITVFFQDLMMNIVLDGKGPKMVMAIATFHCLYQGCKTLQIENDETVVQNRTLSEDEYKKIIIEKFLIDNQHSLKHQNYIDCKKRSFNRSFLIFTKHHHCENEPP